jgi:hypothetical protein
VWVGWVGGRNVGSFHEMLTQICVCATGSCAVNGVAATLIVENMSKSFFFLI